MRAEQVCSNEYCRQRFSEYGFTYDKVTEGDILILIILLNREIKKSNKIGETSVTTMRLSSKHIIKCKPDGTLTECYLFMSSHYFKDRECISFNRDGFIGFAGWADEGNSNPLRRAFLEWCDILKEKEEKE